MSAAGDVLRNAYRATFQEYSRKLDALQCLSGSATRDSGQIEAALLEVEKARVAHSRARDRLAKDLVRPSFSPQISSPQTRSPEIRDDEYRIRATAQLLWELAGRPDGTAECDWRRAERLVQATAASAC